MSIATAEIRRRAIDAYKMGKGSQADIASSYRVDLRTFQRGLSRFNETGETAPRPRGHRQALYSGKQLKALAQLMGKHPDATLEELKNMSGVKGSIMAVQRALNRLGCRYKRNASRQRARPGGCKSLEKTVDPRGGQT
ncbi:MAG: helix-turn-helix domain-containing protein [Kiritimatiellae bacterium]|nr:helix-turn-helix domain-containing protein [Kiritimatiellia bacterium]